MYICAYTAFLTIVLVCIVCSESSPTFGNEYVHIKVHVPKEVTVTHDESHAHDIQYENRHGQKIIHHYHRRRRRPTKKGGGGAASSKHHAEHHDSVLGNLVLSNLKTSISDDHLEYLHHVDDITEHLAKPVFKHVPKKNINTYTIIEETKKVPPTPAQHVETVKIIENKVPFKQVETFKIIETKEKPHHARPEPSYEYKQRLPQVETIKVISSVNREPDSDYHHYVTRKPHVESVKVIESKVPAHAGLEDYGGSGGYYHSARVPTKTVKFVDTYEKPAYYGSDPIDDGYNGSHHDEGASYVQVPADTYLPPKREEYVPVESYLPPRNREHLQLDSYHSAAHVRQNTLYDDDAFKSGEAPYLPPIYSGGPGIIDWPQAAVEGNERETYTGYDSYAAKHVQGVDYIGHSAAV